MSAKRKGIALAAGLLGASLAGVALAQAPPGAERPERQGPMQGRRQEVRQRMLELFASRLRAELGLTDEQFQAIMPLVEAMEEERAAHRRETWQLRMELRRAYAEGAPDTRLEELLQAIERSQREHQKSMEARLQEIDEHLTVRQRVEFRGFLERFRNEMRRRVEDARVRRHLGGPGGPR